jgi:nucleotide-binding universal stress UspA family protein
MSSRSYVMNDAIIRVAADGSAASRRALEWAIDEAELRHCGVELVSVFSPGSSGTSLQGREQAEQAIHATMDDIVAGRAEIPTVSWHVVEGEPADVLVQESERSRLLVMGSHGVSGLRHSALGSVTDLCARMAACPVVVVPPRLHDVSPPHPGRSDNGPSTLSYPAAVVETGNKSMEGT